MLILDATKNKRGFVAFQVFILFYVLHPISVINLKIWGFFCINLSSFELATYPLTLSENGAKIKTLTNLKVSLWTASKTTCIIIEIFVKDIIKDI